MKSWGLRKSYSSIPLCSTRVFLSNHKSRCTRVWFLLLPLFGGAFERSQLDPPAKLPVTLKSQEQLLDTQSVSQALFAISPSSKGSKGLHLPLPLSSRSLFSQANGRRRGWVLIGCDLIGTLGRHGSDSSQLHSF